MLVMEYVPGGSLEERLGERGAPLPTRQVLAWLDDAAAALDAAHAAGVVHRDVKPGNLLLDEQDRVRVADFGIASAAGLGQLTQTGTILGTAGYLSPEQAKGQRAGPASDRYGLAVVAWELLAGRRPFDSGSPTAEATAHVNEPVPPITEANPTLPAALDAVFRRALDKDPARRPASAAELVAELRHAFSADGGATVVLPSRQPRRRPWPAIAAVLALTFAALGALAAVLATHDSESSPPPRTVVHTVTQPGTTVERTVTSTPRQTSGESGATLNNSAFALMQRREFAAALPLLEQAVAKLNGSSDVNEAYADYNLAYTRLALGDCTDVDQLLDRSQAVQGHRHEIDRLRHDAHKRCGPGGKGGEPD
jgi:serine/threonine protein kinase